jgi:hypothetical protein
MIIPIQPDCIIASMVIGGRTITTRLRSCERCDWYVEQTWGGRCIDCIRLGELPRDYSATMRYVALD